MEKIVQAFTDMHGKGNDVLCTLSTEIQAIQGIKYITRAGKFQVRS